MEMSEAGIYLLFKGLMNDDEVRLLEASGDNEGET